MKRFVGILTLMGCSLTWGQEQGPPPAPIQEPVQKEPVQKDEPTQVQKEAENVWTPGPLQQRLHNLHQRVRIRRGIFIQRLDRNLCNLAQQWAEHMASVGRMYHSGMPYAENVAWGYPTCEAAMDAWVNSQGHYSNLVSGSEACGFGAAQGRNGWFWCSLHGGPTTQTTITYSSDGSGSCGSGNCSGRSFLRPFGGRFRIRR